MEDITLDDIWLLVADSMGWPTQEAFAKHELEVESEYLTPVAAARHLIEAARNRGDRIVFISDMYLPVEFVRKQLLVHGLATPIDGVYVSGAIGKTKATGNLFRHVLLQEKTHPGNVLHIGDHRKSDYEVPLSLGIHARHIEAPPLVFAERAILRAGINVDAASGIAGAMRAFRLSDQCGGDGETTELTAQFLGPFALAFASWVLGEARRRGIKRLYFLSRDCQMIWQVASVLAPQFGGIECRYLYMSRQAIYLPSALEVTPQGMPWMRRPFERLTLAAHLLKLELNFSQVSPHLAAAGVSFESEQVLESNSDWEAFWKLVSFPPLRDQIEATIRHRRACAENYFRDSGLFDGDQVTIVDLGWYLTGQAALSVLLKTIDRRSQVQGLYLALKHNRVDRSIAGDSTALFYEPPTGFDAETPAGEIYRRQTLLEHIVGLADHSSVRCYEQDEYGHAAPRLVAEVSQSHADICKRVHQSVTTFAEANGALAKLMGESDGVARIMIATLTDIFFQNPIPATLVPLAGIQVSMDQNQLGASPLIGRHATASIVLGRFGRRWPLNKMFPPKSSHWPEADLAMSSAFAKGAVHAKHLFKVAVRKYTRSIFRTDSGGPAASHGNQAQR